MGKGTVVGRAHFHREPVQHVRVARRATAGLGAHTHYKSTNTHLVGGLERRGARRVGEDERRALRPGAAAVARADRRVVEARVGHALLERGDDVGVLKRGHA